MPLTAPAPCRAPPPRKQVQIAFWERAAREGFTGERGAGVGAKFRAEFDALDKKLAAAYPI